MGRPFYALRGGRRLHLAKAPTVRGACNDRVLYERGSNSESPILSRSPNTVGGNDAICQLSPPLFQYTGCRARLTGATILCAWMGALAPPARSTAPMMTFTTLPFTVTEVSTGEGGS